MIYDSQLLSRRCCDFGSIPYQDRGVWCQTVVEKLFRLNRVPKCIIEPNGVARLVDILCALTGLD